MIRLDVLYGRQVLTPQPATFMGMPIVADPNVPDGQVLLIGPNPGSRKYVANKGTIMGLMRQSFGIASSSLNSKSEVTINEDMTDQFHMIETCQLLVELDRTVAAHGGRFGTRVLNCDRQIISDYSDRLVLTGQGEIHVGEEFVPYGLLVSNSGAIRFVVERAPDEDGEQLAEINRYAALDLDQLEDCFPALATDVNRVLSAELGTRCHPSYYISQTEQRLHGKANLIALVHDYLKNGRLVIDQQKVEQHANEQAGFYGQKDDFGAF